MENYRYGTIYVRKITKDHTEKDIQQALNDVSFVFLFFPSPFSALEKPGSEHTLSLQFRTIVQSNLVGTLRRHIKRVWSSHGSYLVRRS